MFKKSYTQYKAYKKLTTAIKTYLEEEPSDNAGEYDYIDRNTADRGLLSTIDQYMLTFCITLVEHHTPRGGFTSPIISFCAAICRAGSGGG